MWKEYFDFTHQEKRGILIILLLIILLSLSGYFFSKPIEKPMLSATKIALLQSHLVSRQLVDSKMPEILPEMPIEKNYFPFDPNQLSLEDGLRLDLSKKQVLVIQSYIAKGGKFLVPEDLKKIYSLSAKDFDRLLPWVTIPESSSISSAAEESIKPHPTDTLKSLHLNDCTIDDLLKIACLTRPLAERILKFRDKLGGFYTVGQLSEVYGLQNHCLNRLQQLALNGPAAVKKLSINFATRTELANHPYIGPVTANKIDQFRLKNGFIREAKILLQNQLIEANQLEKLLPYLSFTE